MTISELMQPFAVLLEWMRTRTFYLGEYPFTFMDIFVWGMIAGVVVGFLREIME